MGQLNINLGAGYDTLDGDKLRDGGTKINQNFTELYARATTWRIGVYYARTVVLRNDVLHLLAESVTLPFSSTDFDAEKTAGQWIEVVGSGSTPVAADVDVTPSGNLTSTDVQAALEELQADIDTVVGGGNGDMLKSVYDTNDNGQVDSAASADLATDSTNLGGNPASYYASDTDLVTGLATKENAFLKNSAFNKNFGTTATTVAQGNHLHTGVYEPADANIQSHLSDTNIHLSTDERAAMTAMPNAPTSANKFATQADIAAAGGGDMLKSVYDTNDDGTVDSADQATNALNLGGTPAADYATDAEVAALLAGKEDAFTKNSAFNKDFGTTAGTVAEGNHTHAGVYEPADAAIQSHLANTNVHLSTDERAAIANSPNVPTGANPFATQADLSGITTLHGSLDGLNNDDHPQYHNDARGDARYSQLGHGHAIADVTGLQTALDGKLDDVIAGSNITIDKTDPANPIITGDVVPPVSNVYLTNTISFLSVTGDYYGSNASPRTGTLTLSATNAVTGGISVVFYNNATLDVSGVVTSVQGKFVANVLNKLFFERDADGNVYLNIVNDSVNVVASDTVQAGGGTAVQNVVEMTQNQYDGLASPDPDTWYWING